MILIGRGLDFRYDLEPIGGSIRALARRMLPLLQLSKVDRLWVTAIAGKNKTNGQESCQLCSCLGAESIPGAPEEEEKDDGANLPEYVHHFRW